MKKIVISLFDKTGIMVQPWAEAGYECYCYDWQHSGHTVEGNIHKIHYDLSTDFPLAPEGCEVIFTAAFPPCDHLAVSGSRWFKGKGLRKLQQAIGLFATAAEACEAYGAPYQIENPISTISSYWRKPDHTFHPYYYTGYCPEDNYTKKTCLWVGNGFVMPKPNRAIELSAPDNRIHACSPGPDRANIRSATPKGYAKAVFEANHKGT